MILVAIAATALVQWTGPRTEEYNGPGYFCGGGYLVQLAKGDRALILPQGRGAPSARVILSGRNVSIWTGAVQAGGQLVLRYHGGAVTQQNDGGSVAYTISDQTDFALRATSDAFHGFKRDSWFFNHANFSEAAESGVNCLAARSY